MMWSLMQVRTLSSRPPPPTNDRSSCTQTQAAHTQTRTGSKQASSVAAVGAAPRLHLFLEFQQLVQLARVAVHQEARALAGRHRIGQQVCMHARAGRGGGGGQHACVRVHACAMHACTCVLPLPRRCVRHGPVCCGTHAWCCRHRSQKQNAQAERGRVARRSMHAGGHGKGVCCMHRAGGHDPMPAAARHGGNRWVSPPALAGPTGVGVGGSQRRASIHTLAAAHAPNPCRRPSAPSSPRMMLVGTIWPAFMISCACTPCTRTHTYARAYRRQLELDSWSWSHDMCVRGAEAAWQADAARPVGHACMASWPDRTSDRCLQPAVPC